MKDYPLIHFPVDKSCDEMTATEAKLHFDWFMNAIPERIKVLQMEVQKVFPLWVADFTKNSLDDLGKWMKQIVMIRSMTLEERARIVRDRGFTGTQAQMTMEGATKLTSASERIRFDVGIYFAETLRKNIDSLEWKMEKRKNMVDFNSPIIDKVINRPKRCVSLNPMRITRVIALGLIESDWKTDNLLKQYDFEARNFQIGYP